MRKKDVRLASGVVPLVSARPQFRTIPRQWGIMPVWSWQDRMGRRREATPSKVGLLGLLVAPVWIPMRMISRIATEVRRQAEEEVEE